MTYRSPLFSYLTHHRFDERKPRKPIMVNPGSQLDCRVRGITGRWAGAVTPTLSCRFLDGPINIRYRSSSSEEFGEVSSWDQVRRGARRDTQKKA